MLCSTFCTWHITVAQIHVPMRLNSPFQCINPPLLHWTVKMHALKCVHLFFVYAVTCLLITSKEAFLNGHWCLAGVRYQRNILERTRSRIQTPSGNLNEMAYTIYIYSEQSWLIRFVKLFVYWFVKIYWFSCTFCRLQSWQVFYFVF